jgi:hypothetical protein
VVPVTSVYNCILACPTLAALDAVTSTIHLKMKYHGDNGEVFTIHADLDSANRCYKAFQRPEFISLE